MIGFRAEAATTDSAKMLAALIRGASDMRPIFHQVVEPEFYRMEYERFEGEGSPDHWAALSPKYAAWKANHFPGRRILEREGLLKESLTQYPARHQIRRMSEHEFEIGTRHPAAGFHQYGTRKMPKREIIDFKAADGKRLEKLIESWFAKAVKS